MSTPMENTELRKKHLYDGSAWNVYSTEILDLGVGAPGTDLLEPCCDIFRQATEHCLNREKQNNQSLIFQYGPTMGTFEIRSEISKYFSKMYNDPVKSEDLIITVGASHGLHFVLSTLVDFDGYIFVDEFTYMIALDSMKHFSSLKIVPLKLNKDGVDLKDLEAKVKERRFTSKNKEFWSIYFTIPMYHNPTGILFSEEVCRGIVQLARKYDFLVICDDVYNILNYGEKPPPMSRLFAYDDRSDPDYAGNVISNGSFSKIIAPGLRLGWLEVPPRVEPILNKSGIVLSGGCFNNYSAGITASLFQLQLAQPHIERVYEAYKERMLATTSLLSEELPEGCSYLPTTGGYFIWISLPDHLDARDFLQYSIDLEKISFIAGTRFSLEADKGKQSFRITIGFHSKAKLVDGVHRLCRALMKFIEDNPKSA